MSENLKQSSLHCVHCVTMLEISTCAFFSYNKTTVCYINNMGDRKSCNTIAKIWQFALERYNFLSLAHLPGKQNMLVDRESKVFSDQTEWM